MIVRDNTIAAKTFGDFFKNLCKKGLNVSKEMARNVLKKQGRALDITANVVSAVACRNAKQL